MIERLVSAIWHNVGALQVRYHVGTTDTYLICVVDLFRQYATAKFFGVFMRSWHARLGFEQLLDMCLRNTRNVSAIFACSLCMRVMFCSLKYFLASPLPHFYTGTP